MNKPLSIIARSIFSGFYICALSLLSAVSLSAQSFAPSFSFYEEGKTVHFYNTTGADSNIAYFHISYGDGNGDTLPTSFITSKHTYSEEGEYMACLKAYDSTGNFYSYCDRVKADDEDESNDPVQCYAVFYPSVEGYDVKFYNGSTGKNLAYNWQFGDGSTSTEKDPTHTYAKRGSFDVTLSVKDTVSGCTANYATSVYANPKKPCTSFFTYDYEGDYTLVLNAPVKYNESTATYQWNINGTTATGSTVKHTFKTAGIFLVTLTVNDSHCTTTIGYRINVGPCAVEFNHYQDYLDNKLYVQSYGDSMYATSWDFGDGHTATGYKAEHKYDKEGIYKVTMTAKKGSCISVTSHEVEIHLNGYTNENYLAGYVKAGNEFFAHAWIYLMQADSQKQNWITVDSLLFSSYYMDDTLGMPFAFIDLPQGEYYLKAAIDTFEEVSKMYVPTYYGNTVKWQDAKPIKMDGHSYEDIVITMITVEEAEGNGTIEGNVTEDIIGKKEGDVSNIQVMLINEAGKVTRYTYSNSERNFRFSNIPFGNYSIYAEVPGKTSYAGNVNITEGNQHVKGVEVKVSSKQVVTSVPQQKHFIIESWEAYPNPTLQNLNIRVNIKQQEFITWRVQNINGQTIYEGTQKVYAGQNTFGIDASTWADGMYMIELNSLKTGQKMTKKILKQSR